MWCGDIPDVGWGYIDKVNRTMEGHEDIYEQCVDETVMNIYNNRVTNICNMVTVQI